MNASSPQRPLDSFYKRTAVTSSREEDREILMKSYKQIQSVCLSVFDLAWTAVNRIVNKGCDEARRGS